MDNLHGQCEGTLFLTLLLKVFIFSDSFICSGTSSKISGPRKDIDSVSWYAELTWRLAKLFSLRRLCGTIPSLNISFTISGDKLLEILNISVANVCKSL